MLAPAFDSISKTKIQKDKIRLPITETKPNYQSMAILISAIQKQVIHGVVAYTNKKLNN